MVLDHVDRAFVCLKPVDFQQRYVQRDHLAVHPANQQHSTGLPTGD